MKIKVFKKRMEKSMCIKVKIFKWRKINSVITIENTFQKKFKIILKKKKKKTKTDQ